MVEVKNYLKGNIIVNEKSKTLECYCFSQFTGDQCQYMCYSKCINGYCQLNSDNHPYCKCEDDFSGEGCEGIL